MTRAELVAATQLLVRYDDVTGRIGMAQGATRLADVYGALSGLGIDETILPQARQNVSDLLQMQLNGIAIELAALGITLR